MLVLLFIDTIGCGRDTAGGATEAGSTRGGAAKAVLMAVACATMGDLVRGELVET